MNRFLQIHSLTSYPASLLNRDDAGFAKRIPFGGVTRTRISSQCLKRHWRTFQGDGALSAIGLPMSVRSRLTFERYLVEPLVQSGVQDELAREVAGSIMEHVLGKSAKAKAKDAGEEAPVAKEEGDPKRSRKGSDAKTAVAKNGEGHESPAPALHTGQITVLGRPEVDYLLSIAKEVCAGKPSVDKVEKAVKEKLGKEGLKNLKALGKAAAGLDAALFGRMVTSDNLARGDAAVHVAHAFTVHAEASESDYFSAVDDLLSGADDEALGAGHIGSSELTSGLFYSYVAVDVPLLVSNIEACERKAWQSANHEAAAAVVERFVKLVATVSPGAKLGSTAPHAYAHLVLVEAGNAQPRTLANAFLKPVVVTSAQPDLVENAYRAIGKHVVELDAMYGVTFTRRLAALGATAGLCDALKVPKAEGLSDVAAWASNQVRGG
jgi:CRISPR system Cascade subunit CasC